MNIRAVQFVSLGLLLAVVWTASAGRASGTSEAAVAPQESHRINLAGRQRMLTQRMTKSMCFSLVGVEAEHHRKVAVDAADAFDAGLAGLIAGSDALGLGPETNGDILDLLKQVQFEASGLTPSVRQVALGDVHSVAVALVVRLNVPVLARMNAAVGLMETQGTGQEMSAQMAKTLNDAGRQRMLSQRIAKNVCFAAIDVGGVAARKALAADVVTFEKTLAGLMHGDSAVGLLKAPTPQIAEKLAAVRARWTDVRAEIDRIASGGSLPARDLMALDHQIDTILRDMNDAVVLWSQSEG